MAVYIIEIIADIYYRDELCKTMDLFRFPEKLVRTLEGRKLEYELSVNEEGHSEDEVVAFVNRASQVIVEKYNNTSNQADIFFRNCYVSKIYKPITRVKTKEE